MQELLGPSFSIEPLTGNISIGEVVLHPLEKQNRGMGMLGHFALSFPFGEHGPLLSVTLENMPASILLLFFHQKLERIELTIHSPERIDIVWPTKKHNDEEVAFVRNSLFPNFNIQPNARGVVLGWGEVWSYYDKNPLGGGNGLPSHGIQYRA